MPKIDQRFIDEAYKELDKKIKDLQELEKKAPQAITCDRIYRTFACMGRCMAASFGNMRK